jgi:uncharacterized protein
MRETYTIPVAEEGAEDKFIIYRPLLGLAFIGNRAMADLTLHLASLPDNMPVELENDAVKFLANIGFLTPDTPPQDPPFHLTSAVLLLTNRCQLRCGYCYAAAGAFAPKVLKLQTAQTVIDTVCAEAQKCNLPEFRLEFHGGGEPTKEWETLRKSVEYAQSKPLPARIGVTSNAMWSENQCAWLMDHMNSISISMDGNEKTQNGNRPLANGAPSFPVVMRNLKTLDEKKFPYGIRMTATRPWSAMVENVRFIVEQTSCRGIQVEPAFNTERGEHGCVQQGEVESFVEAFQEAYLVAAEHRADLRFSGARPSILTHHFCTAPYDALVVNPEDEIVACYEIVNKGHELAGCSILGRVEDGQVFNNPNARDRLHLLMDERFRACSSCFCRWSCAGDCYVRVFQPGPNGHLVFSERCEMNREITVFLLMNLISNAGGVWRRSFQFRSDENSPYG